MICFVRNFVQTMQQKISLRAIARQYSLHIKARSGLFHVICIEGGITMERALSYYDQSVYPEIGVPMLDQHHSQ